MITHIPHLGGYYKDHVTITELSLQSMVKNAGEGLVFDVMVFDQDSCVEWKQRLASFQDAGYIDNVYFSGNNIGKLPALHKIMGMVDSDILAYTDDDVLFYPNWLAEAVLVLDTFPASLVTGSPILTRFKWYEKQRERFENDSDYEVKELHWKAYPADWLEDDALGRGIALQDYIKIIKNATEGEIRPIQIHNGELGVWGVGHHMQFSATRRDVQQHLPVAGKELMGVMREWDVAMDLAGLTQVATLERTTRHMGNVMDNSIVQDAIDMELVI
jgi:hypothetical protein